MSLRFSLILILSSLFLEVSAAVLVINTGENIKVYFSHEGRIRSSLCGPFTVVKTLSDCQKSKAIHESKWKKKDFTEAVTSSLRLNQRLLSSEFAKNFALYEKRNRPVKLYKDKTKLEQEKIKIENFLAFIGTDTYSEKKIAQINQEILKIDQALKDLQAVKAAVIIINTFIDDLLKKIEDPSQLFTLRSDLLADSDTTYALRHGIAINTKISVGDDHNCVITKLSEVKCWGKGTRAQLKSPKNLVNPREISLGREHSCVIDDNGVQCWGDNRNGQTDVPENLINPRQLSAGFNTTCVITDEGVKCWGSEYAKIANPPADLSNPVALE